MNKKSGAFQIWSFIFFLQCDNLICACLSFNLFINLNFV
jgi:hypothetical protein